MRSGTTRWGGASIGFVMVTDAQAMDARDGHGNPVQWRYTGQLVTKIGDEYGEVVDGKNNAWSQTSNRGDIDIVTLYNLREMNNSQVETYPSARMGNGVSHSGDYPEGFMMRPLEIGSIYPAIATTPGDNIEWWTWQSNGEDGTCT